MNLSDTKLLVSFVLQNKCKCLKNTCVLAQMEGNLQSNYFLHIPTRECLAIWFYRQQTLCFKGLLCKSVSTNYFFSFNTVQKQKAQGLASPQKLYDMAF